MKYRFQPVSRLTLVFILAVLVSGSILTYFSINNISNLKELTEKRILEEQRDLAAQFTENLGQEIEGITGRFEQEIIPSRLFIDSLRKSANAHVFIKQSFLLQNNGVFLYPNFSFIPENSANANRSSRYRTTFSKGETAEFQSNNFRLASNHYRSAIKYGQNATDSAKAMNAVARVSIKSGETEKALNQYNSILNNFCNATDEYGIPYLNFAIRNFVTVHDTALVARVLKSAALCLEKMESGEIPLAWQTEELLVQFSEWLKNSSFQKNKKRIADLTSRIQQQINFFNRWQNEISATLENENSLNHQQVSHSFRVLNSYSASPTELLLVNSGEHFTYGFLIDGDALFQSTLKEVSNMDTEFDYSIAFPLGYSNNQPDISYTALLNPWFPRQPLRIKLDDENAIPKIIRKRSWIYGVASTLLLVAMLLGIYLILRDIAREKRLARLRADFISNVTHELKTPLTSIYMFTESLLLGRVKPAKAKNEYLSVILKESERLKRMISNILEFSKMEKGKPDYFFTVTNMAALINGSLQEMDYWLEKENFEVITELDESIEMKVDADKLKQAFVNLISNAVKYSCAEKKLEIKLYRNKHDVEVEFRDQGIGISQKQLSRIFEKFFRADPKEGISGTGLGLTVVKEIVEAHGGTINAESQVNKGSKFSVILHDKTAEL